MRCLLIRGFRLEVRTDAGRVNASLIALAAGLMALVGAPDLLSQLISIWQDDYSASFPVVPVLAILMGGGLICVLLLVLLEPLLPERRINRRKGIKRR